MYRHQGYIVLIYLIIVINTFSVNTKIYLYRNPINRPLNLFKNTKQCGDTVNNWSSDPSASEPENT